MTEKSELHIWNPNTGTSAYCGKQLCDDDVLFTVKQALLAIERNRIPQPCPDCAHAIIKQLLKAID